MKKKKNPNMNSIIQNDHDCDDATSDVCVVTILLHRPQKHFCGVGPVATAGACGCAV